MGWAQGYEKKMGVGLLLNLISVNGLWADGIGDWSGSDEMSIGSCLKTFL